MEVLALHTSRAVVLENVTEFKNVNDGRDYEWLKTRTKELGYNWSECSFPAHQVGAPTQRERWWLCPAAGTTRDPHRDTVNTGGSAHDPGPRTPPPPRSLRHG